MGQGKYLQSFFTWGLDKANPVGYIGCTVTLERTVTMNRHRQTYFDLNPEQQDNPPAWALILGALCALVGLYCSIVFLFSL